MTEKNFFVYIWLLQRITIYQRMQKIVSIVQILYIHLRHTDKLLDMFFMLLPAIAVILSELHENPRRNNWPDYILYSDLCILFSIS